MIKESVDLAILVLSCDKYSGIWDDFFNLKERFWPDCPYPCYLATDSKDYEREGLQIIHFGNIRTWSICAKKTIENIKERYIALFLEDAFIYKAIDSKVIADDLQFVIDNNVDFLTLERNRMERTLTKDDQVVPHIWRIDRHKKYGIDTSAAIWAKNFLLKALEKEDCNAWQFEVNYCKEAESEEGLKGSIFFDDRQPFNISPIEVVRVGKLRPEAIRFFSKIGYSINKESLPVMNFWEVAKEWIRDKFASMQFGKQFLKRIGKVLGFYVYTENK